MCQLYGFIAEYTDNIFRYLQMGRRGFNVKKPDETLMRAVEEAIDIPEHDADDFRRQVAGFVGQQYDKWETLNAKDESVKLPPPCYFTPLRVLEGARIVLAARVKIPPASALAQWLSYNDGKAKKIVAGIKAATDMASGPILADALEDAGCCDAEVLTHLRDSTPKSDSHWCCMIEAMVG